MQASFQQGQPLTLVCAPAGFGKSTLVVEWLTGFIQSAQQPGADTPRSAWLSLDPADNDPVRFWLYMLAALQTVEPEIGFTCQAMLQSPHPPPLEAMVTALVNELAKLHQPLIMVLDDYHAIKSNPIHQSLSF
ncbi:MAG TPA: LuxR family transcriptional regulator, partial [Anaerolineae bacterium]